MDKWEEEMSKFAADYCGMVIQFFLAVSVPGNKVFIMKPLALQAISSSG